MKDRRRLPRKYLIVYSRVYERNLGKVIGYLADLSQLGAMIISEEPQPVGGLLPIRFDLPDMKLFKSAHLDLSARVVHCEVDVNPEFHNIGFEFLGTTQDQIETIEQMIEAYEFRRDKLNYPPADPATQDGAE